MNETRGETSQKEEARGWFEALQNRIIAAFEAIEIESSGPFAMEGMAPGRFVRKAWSRRDRSGGEGGGGTLAQLRGRVFEKAGVHVSTVFGQLDPEFARNIPGADADPHFWASGISVIAHPWSPHAPTGHMNTRFVVTTKAWFGGGADLTPMLARYRRQDDPDACAFHAAMRQACEAHAQVAPYDKYKSWCDEYFWLKHRNEPRGIGGIFYDYHNSAGLSGGGFAADLAFTRSVGEAFLSVYPTLVLRRAARAWSEEEREEQLAQRGRYVEFNLLYDRGTIFGLKTGGNVESILSSLPPLARWP